MALLTIKNLQISYASNVILDGVNMDIENTEIGCILGPSGSGKTSLLRAIAGFIEVSEGTITIAEQVVSSQSRNLPVNERQVGLVFQDYALFPHLTVLENVSFGLKNIATLSTNQRLEKALYYMRLMGIEEFASVYPADLSGGQQQRVAIARAIAPEPKLLLMDEPFSSLDPLLREQVAQDLRDLIKKLGLTAILVTHDQTEAFAFADKIAVVAHSQLQQFSTPYELYHQPETLFVANFIGEGTLLNGTVYQSEQGFFIKTAIGNLAVEEELVKPLERIDINQGSETQEIVLKNKVTILLRPDDIIHDDSSAIKASIVKKQFRGTNIRYELLLEGSQERVLCFAPSHHDHPLGSAFGLRADVEHLIFFAID